MAASAHLEFIGSGGVTHDEPIASRVRVATPLFGRAVASPFHMMLTRTVAGLTADIDLVPRSLVLVPRGVVVFL